MSCKRYRNLFFLKQDISKEDAFNGNIATLLGPFQNFLVHISFLLPHAGCIIGEWMGALKRSIYPTLLGSFLWNKSRRCQSCLYAAPRWGSAKEYRIWDWPQHKQTNKQINKQTNKQMQQQMSECTHVLWKVFFFPMRRLRR